MRSLRALPGRNADVLGDQSDSTELVRGQCSILSDLCASELRALVLARSQELPTIVKRQAA